MDVFTLVGKMALEGTEEARKSLEEVGREARETASKNEQATKDMEAGWKKIAGPIRAVGIAMTAVGVAGLKLSADARKLNADLGQTAISLGVSTEEMRNLALATTNVTFGLSSVVETFDLLARAGIRDISTLRDTANAFDTLGDAVGSTAEIVTNQMVMAMKTYGLTAEEISMQTDKITYLVRNTALSMDNFASIVGYITPGLIEMGLTMEDTIALLGIMESKGVSGSVATREFRSAISAAETSQIPLNEALGVTSEEMDDYKSKLDDATGLTQIFADEANKQYGIMDRLRQEWSELTLRLGSFLQPLEPILAAMTALGPALIFLSTAHGLAAIKAIGHSGALIGHKIAAMAATVATGKLTLAQIKLNVAMLANPIGLVIAAVAGLIVGIVALIRNWETVVSFLRGPAYRSMKELEGAARDLGNTLVEEIGRATEQMMDKLRKSADDQIAQIQRVIDFIEGRQYIGMDLLGEDVLSQIEEVMPELAANLRAVQDEISAIQEEVIDLDRQWAKERIAEIQIMLEDPNLTLKEQKDLLDELSRLRAREWQQMLDDNRDILISALGEQQSIIETELREELAYWENYFDEIKNGWDGTVRHLENVIIPEFNRLVTEGLLDETAVAEEIQRYREAAKIEADIPLPQVAGKYTAPMEMPAGTLNVHFEDIKWPEVDVKVPGLARGAIVTKPTLAMIGEGHQPEGVFPLGDTNMGSPGEIHLHVGYLIGDDMSMRKLAKHLQSVMSENQRRTSFHQVQEGYRYGTSGI